MKLRDQLWLGEPWRGWRKTAAPVNFKLLVAALIIFILGLALDVTLLLAIAWTLALRAWLAANIPAEKLLPCAGC